MTTEARRVLVLGTHDPLPVALRGEPLVPAPNGLFPEANASAEEVVVVEPFAPPDPVRAISELHRVLATGGRLLVLTPAGVRPGAAWRAALKRSGLFAPLATEAPAEGAQREWAARRGAGPGQEGIVASVNTSPGGVPKRPVDGAWVERLGVQGDGHVYAGHGGEKAAVCLLAQEAIERMRADGHELFPGAVGENLTVLGLDWAALRAGDRIELGSGLVLELTQFATPCQTIAHWFIRRRIARIGQQQHPGDARWYARVLVEGRLEPGDIVHHVPAGEARATG